MAEVYIPSMGAVAQERSRSILHLIPNSIVMSYSEWTKLDEVLSGELKKWAESDYKSGAIAEIE